MAAKARAAQPSVLEASDLGTVRIPAAFLMRGSPPRDPAPYLARLSEQFIAQNETVLSAIGARAEPRYNGRTSDIEITASTTVGAVPLRSPTSGLLDYGLIVKPRFDWTGIGPMLAETGLRVAPKILSMPLLPQSERRVPAWVLSATVLVRIEALLRQLTRRFDMVSTTLTAPRGRVDWQAYATRSIGRGQHTHVPCTYPELRTDAALRGAIRYALQRQLASLSTQTSAGAFVLALIAICEGLLRAVSDAPARIPAPLEFERWLRSPLQGEVLRDGLQAIHWTVDERGLGGLSDLEGLPWRMSMEEFFEAWTESVAHLVSRRIGGIVRTGRQRQTVTPIEWRPAYRGSQRSLVPDVMLDRGDLTVIIDAKYKEHWEEMQEHRWGDLEEQIRERHRNDLLQVLAYANVTSAPRVVLCLAYPCRRVTYDSLKERGLLFSRAALRASERQIDLLLTAFPMGVSADEVAGPLAAEIVREG